MEYDKEIDKWRTSQNLDSMTKAQLIQYAEENGIEIDKTAKKAEILEKVKQ